MWAADKGGTLSQADPYQALVRVTGQGEAERTAALRAALTEIITHLSGRTVTAARGQRAEDMVSRYRYEPAAAGYQLVIDFDPASIDRLIPGRRIAARMESRSSAVVWLVVQGADGTARLTGSDGPSPYQQPIQDEAQHLGVSLVWPIMDLLETTLYPPQTTSELVDTLRKASRSYLVEAVWIGILNPLTKEVLVTSATPKEGATTAIHWILSRGSTTEEWDVAGETRNAVLATSVDRLAERLAVSGSPPNETPATQQSVVSVVASGVTSLESYAELCGRLEGLPVVARAAVTQIEPEGRITFALEPRESTGEIDSALRRTGRLVPETQGTPSAPREVALYYHWSSIPKR